MMVGRSRGLLFLALGGMSWAFGATPGADHLEGRLRLDWAGDHGKPVTALEKAAGANPEDLMSAFRLGSGIGRRAGQMTGLCRLATHPMAEKSRAIFEKSVALDPSNVEAPKAVQGYNLNAPGIAGGGKDAAKALAGRIEALDKMRSLLAWADDHETVGDVDSARERFAMAQALDTKAIGCMTGNPGFLARPGRTAASDALSEQDLAAEPGKPAVALGAAQAWIRAKQRFERCLATLLPEPNSDPASHVRRLLKGL